MPGATIAACLIVKDEERTLERCLMSLRPFVDEVNVYDTGSTDGTLALLDRLARESTIEADGAHLPLAPIRVVRGEWRDDFSWARAQSFAMASPDAGWLLWADADDEIVGGARIRAVVSELDPDIDVLVCAYDAAVDNEGQPRVRTWRERLVRADAGFTWQGTVHEYLAVPAGERRKARRVDPETLRWLHTSHGEWDPRRNIAALQATLARSEASGEPPDARALFHLGAELFWVGDFGAARAGFDRWLELYGGTTDDALFVVNKLAACARLDGDLDNALRLELEAFEARPDWLPTAAGLVQSYAAAHRWADVVEWAERAIALDPPQTAVPIVLLEVTVVPRLRLAEAELALGRTGPARTAFRSAAMLVPGAESLRRHRARFEELLDGAATSQALREVRAAIAPYDETMRAALRGLTLDVSS